MGYKAAETVTELDYHFQPHTDAEGVTPEPSRDQIKAYWVGYQAMLRRNRAALEDWERRLQALSEDDRTGREAVEAEFAAWQDSNADETLAERRRLLAEVCSGQPSLENLDALPGRVFDDFEGYMQEELTPKGRRSGSN